MEIVMVWLIFLTIDIVKDLHALSILFWNVRHLPATRVVRSCIAFAHRPYCISCAEAMQAMFYMA